MTASWRSCLHCIYFLQMLVPIILPFPVVPPPREQKRPPSLSPLTPCLIPRGNGSLFPLCYILPLFSALFSHFVAAPSSPTPLFLCWLAHVGKFMFEELKNCWFHEAKATFCHDLFMCEKEPVTFTTKEPLVIILDFRWICQTILTFNHLKWEYLSLLKYPINCDYQVRNLEDDCILLTVDPFVFFISLYSFYNKPHTSMILTFKVSDCVRNENDSFE